MARQITRCQLSRVALSAGIFMLLGACASRPPTIAHTHIGHALTAVHVTPDRQGYFTLAEKRAQTSREITLVIGETLGDNDRQLSAQLDRLLLALDDAENFGLKQSLIQSSNHISFAATADDASGNLRLYAPRFAANIRALLERTELMTLLAEDLRRSDSEEEKRVLTTQLDELARQNVEGDASAGASDAVASADLGGIEPDNYGVAQLRTMLDQMVAGEDPPYRTVDRWYLFNLVRLPNGLWVFDQLGRDGNIDGYK